jgi:hypothetical protein
MKYLVFILIAVNLYSYNKKIVEITIRSSAEKIIHCWFQCVQVPVYLCRV